jgi:hypothetical protein
MLEFLINLFSYDFNTKSQNAGCPYCFFICGKPFFHEFRDLDPLGYRGIGGFQPLGRIFAPTCPILRRW